MVDVDQKTLVGAGQKVARSMSTGKPLTDVDQKITPTNIDQKTLANLDQKHILCQHRPKNSPSQRQ